MIAVVLSFLPYSVPYIAAGGSPCACVDKKSVLSNSIDRKKKSGRLGDE